MKEEEGRITDLVGFKVKFQERGGTPLWLTFSTNLAEGISCGRDKCKTCRQDDERKVDCFDSRVVYESSCDLCHPQKRNKKEKPNRGIDKGEGTYGEALIHHSPLNGHTPSLQVHDSGEV